MEVGMVLSALGAGLLSFFSPCILPLLPVYIGILTTDAGAADNAGERVEKAAGDACASAKGATSSCSKSAPAVPAASAAPATSAAPASPRRHGFLRRSANTIAFVLGISFTFVLMGVGAGALGSIANNSYVAIAMGLLITVFGLYLAGVISIPALDRHKQADMSRIRVRGVVGSFLLGLAFSFGWTPCVGPILGSILALAAEQGSAAVGAGLLLVYSLGLCVPFLVLTIASTALMGRIRKLGRYLPIIQRIGGALIAIMGLWMTFSQVHDLVNATNAAREEAALVQMDDAGAGSSDGSATVSATGSAAGDGEAGAGSAAGEAAGSSTSSSTGDAGASAGAGATGGTSTNALGITSAWRNVALRDLDGNTVRFSSLKGKPVYFEFWGSWCSSCVADLGQLQALYDEHVEKGDVQVVSVVTPGSYGEKSADDFVTWAAENGVNFPVYMDTRASLVSYIGVSGFPTSVFVDADGTIVKVRPGAIEHDELEEMLDELAAGTLG